MLILFWTRLVVLVGRESFYVLLRVSTHRETTRLGEMSLQHFIPEGQDFARPSTTEKYTPLRDKTEVTLDSKLWKFMTLPQTVGCQLQC